jgi:hypothetical protein
MAANPADRNPSAEVFQKALERFLVGPTIRELAAGANRPSTGSWPI